MSLPRTKPGPGQESVWDYPRPPRVEETTRHVTVVYCGEVIADTYRAKRVLETSHPPVYYIPPEDTKMEYLTRTGRRTWCEWKGRASYFSIGVGDRKAKDAAWFYPSPVRGYEMIREHVAFYPG